MLDYKMDSSYDESNRHEGETIEITELNAKKNQAGNKRLFWPRIKVIDLILDELAIDMLNAVLRMIMKYEILRMIR
jgi:hypothetical protein